MDLISQPELTQTAVAQCLAAWNRAYAKELKDSDNPYIAAEVAGKAWCCAMPLLSTHQGICDFVACVAQGILLGAIPENRAAKLLYAAQVARSTLPPQAKADSARKDCPPSPPPLTYLCKRGRHARQLADLPIPTQETPQTSPHS